MTTASSTRFLILSQYFPPEIGAPQTRLSALCSELQRRGHEVEVVTAMPNYPEGRISGGYRGRLLVREEHRGVTVHRVWLYAAMGVGFRRMLNYASFAAASVAGLLRARRPDVVFVESPPLFLVPVAVLAARIWRARLVLNVADLWPDAIREMGTLSDGPVLRVMEALEAWAYRRATFVTAVTEGIRAELEQGKGVPPKKLLYLPNGADVDLFRPRSADTDLESELGLTGKKAVVYAGNVGYAQGVGVALRAMKRLRTECPEVVLVILGDGSERRALRELAEAEGLDNVRFLDPRPLEYVARLYSVAYAGFASLIDLPIHEGARPSKLLPIMASGVPVLYSGRGEGARLVEGAGAGVVTPPEDAEALADAIRELAGDPERAEGLGRRGRSFAVDHLSWQALVGSWLTELDAGAR